MTEQEQLKKYVDEFIAAIKDYSRYPFSNFDFKMLSGGQVSFSDDKLDDYWEGFLMAKRSQPVIELPTPFHDSISGYECDELHNTITDAG